MNKDYRERKIYTRYRKKIVKGRIYEDYG